ncbi:MAG: radical SAM family RiPP maturation amino acid epimerase [Desulfarculus sp.]|nr:radical SAM family RiPP maturation amino acid epimerase [Desulfarculus sp.]
MTTQLAPAPLAATGAAPPADPFEFHRWFTSARSQEQKRLIARIKRFLELVMADQEFRLALKEHPEQAAELTSRRGLEVDPHALEPLWRQGFTTIIPKADYKRWPQLGLWCQWVRDILKYRDLLFLAGDPGPGQPAFAKWRGRRAAANDFLLGPRNKAIVYPVFAYELSKGCSQGCWFCAFAAPRLEAVFRYDRANARLWNQILETGLEMMGLGAAQSGFCYWATEPSDNPDYLRFLEDFRRVNGMLCQTTTAAATRDPAWTRRMLALYDQEIRAVKPRFSVLSLKMLAEIHRLFSPDELLRVECIPQNPESILYKAKTGRAARDPQDRWRQEYRQRKNEQRGESLAGEASQPEPPLEAPDFGGTTACVSGYLVNMVERTVMLVSPCQASARWPLGYRVHAQGRFDNAADYRAFIARSIAEHMPPTLPSEEPARFNEDVAYLEGPPGPVLRSRVKAMGLEAAGPAYAPAAEMLAQGGLSPSQIMGRLMDQGQSPLEAAAVLGHFFDMGLLD